MAKAKKRKSTRKKPNFFTWLKGRPRVKSKNNQIKVVETRLKKLKRELATIKKAETAKYKKL